MTQTWPATAPCGGSFYAPTWAGLHPGEGRYSSFTPGAWHFAAGHIPKLELLGDDAPYLRPSNGTFTITVRNLVLRLPVHERPGSVRA